MPAIDFPANPTLNQTFSAAGKEWKWDGSAWQLINSNTNIISKTIIDAKGDLIVGTGSDAVEALSIGADGRVLTASSSATGGIIWQAPTGTGNVVLSNSPTFTGIPISTTASVNTNTTQIATTAFVNTEISNDAVTKVTYTAKGDILTASASGAPLILSVGTNGQVLTASSTATGGLVWAPATAGATGGGTDQVFYNNDQTVTTDYSIPSGKNSISAGPITINSGISVTIPSGSVWVIA